MISSEDFELKQFFFNHANFWRHDVYENLIERKFIEICNLPTIIIRANPHIIQIREYMKRQQFYNFIIFTFMCLTLLILTLQILTLRRFEKYDRSLEQNSLKNSTNPEDFKEYKQEQIAESKEVMYVWMGIITIAIGMSCYFYGFYRINLWFSIAGIAVSLTGFVAVAYGLLIVLETEEGKQDYVQNKSGDGENLKQTIDYYLRERIYVSIVQHFVQFTLVIVYLGWNWFKIKKLQQQLDLAIALFNRSL